MGARDNLAEFFFNGTIDEPMILNRSLSFAEAQQLYFTNLYTKHIAIVFELNPVFIE